MIKQFIEWLKQPFYRLDDSGDFDGVLIAAIALAVIIFIVGFTLLL